MDVDVILQEISFLQHEIVEIQKYLTKSRWGSEQSDLHEKLRQKQYRQSMLSELININFGNDNNFSNGNLSFGTYVGHNLNQFNETNSINTLGGNIGDNTIVAGRDVYIYPNREIQKDTTPIDLRISFTASLSSKIVRETKPGRWFFSSDISINRHLWDIRAPFQVDVEIADKLTNQIKRFTIHTGELQLTDTSFIAAIEIYGSNRKKDKYKRVYSKTYVCSTSDKKHINDAIISIFGKLSRDGYDVDNEIIKFRNENYIDTKVDVIAFQEKYEVFDYSKRFFVSMKFEEKRLDIKYHNINILNIVVTRRKHI
jgi:hypothetical protein